jgi:hypothetical protein
MNRAARPPKLLSTMNSNEKMPGKVEKSTLKTKFLSIEYCCSKSILIKNLYVIKLLNKYALLS